MGLHGIMKKTSFEKDKLTPKLFQAIKDYFIKTYGIFTSQLSDKDILNILKRNDYHFEIKANNFKFYQGDKFLFEVSV